MSDADKTDRDPKTEQQEDQKAAERREFLKRGAITVGAGWLALGGVGELLASPRARSGVASQPSLIEQQPSPERLDRAVRQMEKHVRKNPDGTFELKAKSAEEAGLDQEAFEQLRLSLEQGNQYVKDYTKLGKLRAEEVRATTGRPEDDMPRRSGPPGGR
jgi:hypothetical protein